MMTIWYHGTNESSAKDICLNGINFSKSKDRLDFGRGFYLTDDENLARQRAYQKTLSYNHRLKCNDKAALVSVEVDMKVVETLNTRTFEYCNREWLEFVLANRFTGEFLNVNQNLEHNLDLKYDVVIGSIADSDISNLATFILNGDKQIDDVSEYDVLTDEGRTLGEQLSLHTTASLNCIKTKQYSIIERRS